MSTVRPTSGPIERRTFCRFCIAVCGAIVTVDGDEVLAVRGDPDHHASHGYLCPKGRALGIAHHDPKRLDAPLLRGETASWEALLGDVGPKLRAIIDEHGPDSVAFVFGTAGSFDASGRRTMERLQQLVGSRSMYSNMTVDTPCKPLVSAWMGGSAALVAALDHEHATLTVLVGCNPVVSHGHMNGFPDPVTKLRALADAADGRELWVIDPRRTETARLATHHLAPRPGTDHVLLAALVRAVLAGGGVDAAYVADHTSGVAALGDAVEPFDLERAAVLTDIPLDDLHGLVDAIRRHGRIAIQTGTGATFTPQANVTEWLVWALSIITGSYDRPGGMWFNPGWFHQLDVRGTGRPFDGSFGPAPVSRPDLARVAGEIPSAALADEIEAGVVRAAIVCGSNPLTAFPDADRMRAALQSLEVLVVGEVVHNDLTAVATHVMPLAGQLERADLPFYIDRLQHDVSALYGEVVVAPAAERRTQWRALAQLGRAMGLTVLPSGLDPDMATDDDVLAPMASRGRGGADGWAAMRAEPGRTNVTEPVFGWVAEKVLPEGRWQLAPAPFVAQLAAWDAASPSAGAGADELVLISRRQPRHMNAQMAGLALGGGHEDRPELGIHPEDADRLGLAAGDMVEVESAHGCVTTRVVLDGSLRPGAASLPHGFERSNVGRLTSPCTADPLSGMPAQTAIVVMVRKVADVEESAHMVSAHII